MEDQLVDWLSNVWGELGEDTTRQDIIRDFTEIVGEQNHPEELVEAWFKDHGDILSSSMAGGSWDLMLHDDLIRTWVFEHLDEDGEFQLELDAA